MRLPLAAIPLTGLLFLAACDTHQGAVPSATLPADSHLSRYLRCVPLTCEEIGASCGLQGDGCGHEIFCGNCRSPETCGGGGTPNVCGNSSQVDGGACQPRTCADWGADCGPVSDGCGGLVQCGDCPWPQTCGGGGTPSVCATGSACVPATCETKGADCGPVDDGCGGLLYCGDCTGGQTCGGGGKPSVCGTPAIPDGGSGCVPLTCSQLGYDCGPAGDGCGGLLKCGDCSGAQTCGGGGVAEVCGGNQGCVPSTCAQLGVSCGPAGDGCGGTLDCGPCIPPQTCGGGGTPGVCGGFNACVPKTCAQLGFNCGPASDGCGGLLQCGSCLAPESCGGGGAPGVCGPAPGTASSTCTGLCTQQVTCSGVADNTTVTGTVLAPNGTDPIYNALVYVPNGDVAPTYGVTAFSAGVHCGQCGSEVSGSPLVQTLSAPDGTFELRNVPAGTNIPLLIQVGRWRRKVTIPTVTQCKNTALAANLTRLPSSQPGSTSYPPAWYPAGDNDPADNIPLMAFSTGAVDALECVFLKIGVDQSQFSDPSSQGGNGRIRLYTGESAISYDTFGNILGGPGAGYSAKTPSATQLWGTGASGGSPDINQYDMVFLPCQGVRTAESSINQANVIDYTKTGGRVFATHFSYTWIYNDSPFDAMANWNVSQGAADSAIGTINTSFDRGHALAQWLQIVGASTTYDQLPLSTVRYDFSGVVAPAQLWVQASNLVNVSGSNGATAPAAPWPVHFTFDTPVNSPAGSQCGRVLFDDFHVENTTADTGTLFPSECVGSAMTAQEKMLEFMIFDLGSCLLPTAPPVPPSCTAQTCAQQGFNCGPAGDGCGNEIASCGTCTAPQTCGGGGTPGVCGGTACNPLSCTSQGIQCGPAGDGCGHLLQCGNCQNGETCGGGGVPGKCGKPSCTPVTCEAQGISCGPAGDGCGHLIVCGGCPSGQTCGGGGVPGKCGAVASCMPLSCDAQGISCGPAGDGCGGTLECGSCPAGQSCGGGGTPGVCGAPACLPVTCAELGVQCGPAGDGCGGQLDCGSCPGNQECGACAAPGTCGSCCVPTTCEALGYDCGPAGDGCGGTLDCGQCTAPQACGGAGKPGHCG